MEMDGKNKNAGFVPPAGASHPQEESPAEEVGNQASSPRMATGSTEGALEVSGAQLNPFARRGLLRTPPAPRSLSAPDTDRTQREDLSSLKMSREDEHGTTNEGLEKEDGQRCGDKRKPTSPAGVTLEEKKQKTATSLTREVTEQKASELEVKITQQLDRVVDMFAHVDIDAHKFRNVMVEIKALIKEAKAWTEVSVPSIKTAFHGMKLLATENVDSLSHKTELLIQTSKMSERKLLNTLEKYAMTIEAKNSEVEKLKAKLATAEDENRKLREASVTSHLQASDLPQDGQARITELEEKLRMATEKLLLLQESPDQRKARLEKENILATREAILCASNGDGDITGLLDREWPKGAYLNTKIVKKGLVQTSVPKVVLLSVQEEDSERETLQKLGTAFPAVLRYAKEGGPKLKTGQIVIIKAQDSVALMSTEPDDGDHIEEPSRPRTLVIGKTNGHSSEEVFAMTAKLFGIARDATAAHEGNEEGRTIMYTFPTGLALTKARKIVEVAHAKEGCIGEVFARDKKQRSSKDEALQDDNREEQRQPRKKGNGSANSTRTSTLVIENKGGDLYSDKVKALQEKVNPGEVGGVVVQATSKAKDSEDIVIVVKETQEGGREALMNKIRDAVAMNVVARDRPIRANLIIYDVDTNVTKEKVDAELRKLLGGGRNTDLEVDEPRTNHAGKRCIAIRADHKSSEKLLKIGRVNLGWGPCAIRETVKPRLCNDCLKPGHIAKNCPEKKRQGERLCFNCGKAGHTAKTCKNTRCCPLCKQTEHGVGSMACEVYRLYTTELRSNRAAARKEGQVGAASASKERKLMESGGFTYVTSGAKPLQIEVPVLEHEEEDGMQVTENDPEAQADTTNQLE